MKRIAALVAAAILLSIQAVPPAAQAADKRPNVLLIMTDQQPISMVGAYGNPLAKTPSIDRLAREGMRLDGVHIAAFACSPSRASYWTGRYPHHHGIVVNDVVLSEDTPTLGSVLHAAGYQTAFVGKWHLGGNMYVSGEETKWSHNRIADPEQFRYGNEGPWRGGEDEPQCGFVDKWAGGWAQYHDYLRRVGLGDLLAKGRKVGNHNDLPSGPEGTHIHSQLPEEHHMAAFFAGEAEQFIRKDHDSKKPFCMVLSFYGPHLPVAPPQPWDTMLDPANVPLPENHVDPLTDKPGSQQNNSRCYKGATWTDAQFRDYIARYHGYCAYIDKQIGRVLAALDQQGLADDTIVIFTTDHGDMVGAHSFVFKLGSGYDELMRVPFLIRYPGGVRNDAASDALVQSIDVLPTLLDYCGVQAPAGVDGRTFRPLLEGKIQRFRDYVVTHTNGTIMIRDARWKLVYTDARPKAFLELYDLKERPLEVRNRAADPQCADALARMKGLLATWLHDSGHPYADVIEPKLATARTRSPSADELVTPRVADFRQTESDSGETIAEFSVAWRVGSQLSTEEQYWCFLHIVAPSSGNIATRDTLWPDPPTTEWTIGTDQSVGPMQVPIPKNLKGDFPVRIGLYNPKKGTRPDVDGNAQQVVGTLTIDRTGEKVQLKYKPGKPHGLGCTAEPVGSPKQRLLTRNGFSIRSIDRIHAPLIRHLCLAGR